MAKYKLFENIIQFTEAEERAFDYQESLWQARAKASELLAKWYVSCGDIKTVLTKYPGKAQELINQYAIDPLYDDLAKIGIYDMPKTKFMDECGSVDGFADAFDEIRDYYNSIIDQLESEIEYRAERKEARGRVVGGGFGFSGAVKGMATAGAMNAISGLGHSIVNSIGNVGSEIDANAAKQRLYKNNQTLLILQDGIKADILAVYNSFMVYVNREKGDYICNVFHSDKAETLFQNAKRIDAKRKELLCEAFKLCPWDIDVLTYIYINYREERKNVWTAARRFRVDLHPAAEEVFSKMYDAGARNSEEKAVKVKKEIASQMKELGITVSGTFDRIEKDGVSRILGGYDTANKENRMKMFAAVEAYDAADRNKACVVREKRVWELAKKYRVTFTQDEIEKMLSDIYTQDAQISEERALVAKERIKTIMAEFDVKDSKIFDALEHDCIQRLCNGYLTADETTCNEMLTAISAYDALDKNKKPYVYGIRARIEAIWAAEDGEVFDNLYLSTNIQDQEEISKALEYIKSKKRTSSAGKYITAFTNCNTENIRKARIYQQTTTKFCKPGGIALIAIGILTLFMDIGLFVSLAISAMGLILFSYYNNLKKVWDKLTINGTLVHASISLSGTAQRITQAVSSDEAARKIDEEVQRRMEIEAYLKKQSKDTHQE